jgi:hypothetical protein
MRRRQPGTTGPGTTGPGTTGPGTTGPGTTGPGTTGPGTTGPGTTGETGMPDGGPRTAPGQPWAQVVPLALLILLGLAGLRGAAIAPRWNGPLRHDGVVIGLTLEVILGILLAATVQRRAKALRTALADGVPVSGEVAKLRAVLIFLLAAGMIAAAVGIIVSLHLRVSPVPPPTSPFSARPRPSLTLKPRPGSQGAAGFHVPLAAILYGLLIVALVVAVVLSIWWSRRFRLSPRGRHTDFIAEDPEDLREAVESGRSALRTVDDARAAIIACYVAMERSLAERGTARAVADTPDELLARATASGLVHGTAAARLTALFYEARFSSHPLGRAQRDAAERALDELAAALARGDEPPRPPRGSLARGDEPAESGAGA